MYIYKSFKCPYCGKVFESDLGVTEFYKYKDKKVIGQDHGCGPFITELNDSYLDIIKKYYGIENIPLSVRNSIYKIIENNIQNVKDENDMFNIVVQELQEERPIIELQLTNIIIYIQICMSYFTMPRFSLPLTEDIKKELILDHVICFD